ncbi:MAG: cell division protein FtsL [Bacilli bacterium]
MASKNKRKLKLLKGEKFMYGLLICLILAIPMFNVYTSSLLSETNNELEKLKNNIEKQELTNQSLSMQIDELASLENIEKIAEEYGLSYINDNIKIVSAEGE